MQTAKSASYDALSSDDRPMYGGESKAKEGSPMSRSGDTFHDYRGAPSVHHSRPKHEPTEIANQGESYSTMYHRNAHPHRHYSMVCAVLAQRLHRNINYHLNTSEVIYSTSKKKWHMYI